MFVIFTDRQLPVNISLLKYFWTIKSLALPLKLSIFDNKLTFNHHVDLRGAKGCYAPPAILMPPLGSQYYIDTRNWNHAFTLYSEV